MFSISSKSPSTRFDEVVPEEQTFKHTETLVSLPQTYCLKKEAQRKKLPADITIISDVDTDISLANPSDIPVKKESVIEEETNTTGVLETQRLPPLLKRL